MRFPIRPLAAAVAVLLAQSAAAGPGIPTLEEVTVDGVRRADLPDAETVDEVALDTRSAAGHDTAGLLEGLPGLSLWGAGGVSSLPALRGLADDRLRIRLDGMDLVAGCPNHMNPPLSYATPAQVEAIKVYAGITPVSVGGDSIGGSIEVNTAAPRFAREGEGLVAGGEIGSNARGNGDAFGADAAFTLATERFQVAYTGSTARADNYRAGGDFRSFVATGNVGRALARDEVGSSGYEVRNHQLGVAFRSGTHQVDVRFATQDMPFQNFPNQRMDLVDNDQERINLHYLGQYERLTFDARLWHESLDHAMDFGDDKRFWYGMASNVGGMMGDGRACSPISATCAAGMPMLTAANTNGGRLQADVALRRQDVLRVGGEFLAYRLDDYWPPSGSAMWPGTFVNLARGQRDRLALFGEWEAQSGAHWTHLLGLRIENVDTDAGDVRGYDVDPAPPGSFMMTSADAAAFNARERTRTDHNWDLTALARWTPSDTFSLEFGVARKTRSPSLYERYAWSSWSMAAVMNNTVGDGNGYVGDPDLEPEVAWTASAAFDWHAADRRWQLRAMPYWTRVSDYIDAVAITAMPNAFNVLRHANQDARLAGIDLDARFVLADTGFGRFTLRGTAGVTDGTNRDTGDALYNIMPENARLTLEHRIGAWDSALELIGVGAKDELSKVRNEIGTAGYGLLNLRAGWAWKTLRVDAGLDNLFDRLYRLPQGGAYLGQGATMMINGVPWGIAVPGPSRTAWIGLRFAF
jgi:iron complex outermembrane receptor protein